ncbi:RraA family protein [Blautia obeum]|uniref:RraA family protein n=1 Tax=Blautia obeum TaxID=40520 RepID=UPI0002D6F135|nr:RraA family protein [Blautia obeum]
MKYDVNELKHQLYSGILCDVMDGMGYRNQAISNKINPLNDETVIFGPAFTSIGTEVYSMPEDPLTAQCKVVDQLGEGEIYVLVTRGNYNCAVFGELFATAVKARKGAGVLLDGYARDLKALKEMDFPVFFRGKNPKTSKGRCEINECQIPVTMDGVTIRPGDYIFGDIDGTVIIPKEIADEVLEKALETIKKENVVRSILQNGGTLQQAYAENGAI